MVGAPDTGTVLVVGAGVAVGVIAIALLIHHAITGKESDNKEQSNFDTHKMRAENNRVVLFQW